MVRVLAATLLIVLPGTLAAQTAADAATCSRAAERAPTAIAAMQRLAGSAGNAALGHFARGCLALSASKPDSAVTHFEAAATASPQNTWAQLWFGNAMGEMASRGNVMLKARLATRIRDAYLRAVDADGNNVEARNGLLQFYLQAPAVMGGDVGKAREQANAIAARRPYQGIIAQLAVAQTAQERGSIERLLVQGNSQFPDSSLFAARLAAWQADNGKAAEAFATIARWQQRRPNLPVQLFMLGRTAAVTGQQLEQGEQALRKYLVVQRGPGDPSVATAHLRLAQVLEKRGQLPAAKREYRAVLAIEPENREARAAVERLP